MDHKVFKYKDFTCDVRIFRDGHDFIAKFYERAKEHAEKDIGQYVIVAQGFGYI